jgi:hypothetical protein
MITLIWRDWAKEQGTLDSTAGTEITTTYTYIYTEYV